MQVVCHIFNDQGKEKAFQKPEAVLTAVSVRFPSGLRQVKYIETYGYYWKECHPHFSVLPSVWQLWYVLWKMGWIVFSHFNPVYSGFQQNGSKVVFRKINAASKLNKNNFLEELISKEGFKKTFSFWNSRKEKVPQNASVTALKWHPVRWATFPWNLQ